MLDASRDSFPWVGPIHLVSGKPDHDYLTEAPSESLEILKKGSPSGSRLASSLADYFPLFHPNEPLDPQAA